MNNIKTKTYFPSLEAVQKAKHILKDVVITSPLALNLNYSRTYKANIYLKREDLQQVRSYKIRGAYNKMSSLSSDETKKGIVCASAGNHAQGVAFACNHLKINGTIFMPSTTPKQKIEQVEMFGNGYVEVRLKGDTFDDSYNFAKAECEAQQKIFVHPFNDEKIIEGQATVGLEILDQTKKQIDYLFLPIGGGGLASGVSTIFKLLSPKTKIIGVEPQGAPAMQQSIQQNKLVTLKKIDKFVDGAAVQQVGNITFTICKETLDEVVTVPEGKICQTILDLYNRDAVVVEPAGALTLTALDEFAEEIKGKNVVCLVSGSNNDITRTAEIKERALLFADLKHYFIVRFPQRAGALKEFVADILGPNDDITHFQYTKKSSRENGSAVVGIELKTKADFEPLIERMKLHNFYGDYINNKPDLFQFLV